MKKKVSYEEYSGAEMPNPWLDYTSDTSFFDSPELQGIRDEAVEFCLAGVPIHLSGPAGLGKTTMAFQIANSIGRPISVMTGNAWLDSSDFIGGVIGSSSTTIVDRYVQSVRRTEKNSKADWKNSALAIAMLRGHTFIYDEFTRASPEANANLLSVLEEGLLVCTDPSGPERQIRAHQKFRMILTSNPKDYVAVNFAPDALLDRMVTFPMAPLNLRTIGRIVEKRCSLDAAIADEIVNQVHSTRAPQEDEKFSLLRSSVFVGRVAAFRLSKGMKVGETEICEIATSVLKGRGVLNRPDQNISSTRAA